MNFKNYFGLKRKNTNYQSYIRHHTKDVDSGKIECVQASKISGKKTILQ